MGGGLANPHQSMQCSFTGCYQANTLRSNSPALPAALPLCLRTANTHSFTLTHKERWVALSCLMKRPSFNLRCQHRKIILTGCSVVMNNTSKLPFMTLWMLRFPAKSYISDALLFLHHLAGARLQAWGMLYQSLFSASAPLHASPV